MPQLLQTIYEIAVEKGRDVLCIVFGDPRVPPPYYEGLNLKTVVTPFRQHYFGEIRPLEAGQSRSMCV
jgi:hypothetical protein